MRIGPGEAFLKRKSGYACIGSAGEIVNDKYVLPSKFRGKIHVAQEKCPVIYKEIQVGYITGHSIMEGHVCYLFRLTKSLIPGTYTFTPVFFTLFATQENDKYLLDDVIIESITINAQDN
jgi:hypothetical protein